MKIRKIATACMIIVLSVATAGCSSNDTMSSATDLLSNDALASSLSGLGLDADQLGGGLGSIMSLAENKLSAGDFSKLADVLPNAQKYVDMAKSAGLLDDPIGTLQGLNSAMSKLGISPSTATDLFSKFGEYAAEAGGADLGSKVAGLFM